MPPLVLNRYLSTEHRAVRVGLYYLTWTAYYLSFLVSPGLLTIVQLVVMLVDFVLPNVAAWIEHDVRGRLSSCRYAKLESTPPRPLRAPATGPTTVISNAVDWIASWCRSSLPSRGLRSSKPDWTDAAARLQSGSPGIPLRTNTVPNPLVRFDPPRAAQLSSSRQRRPPSFSHAAPPPTTTMTTAATSSSQPFRHHAGRLGSTWSHLNDNANHDEIALRSASWSSPSSPLRIDPPYRAGQEASAGLQTRQRKFKRIERGPLPRSPDPRHGTLKLDDDHIF
ncbi:hypothetical protein JCM3766R1_007184 [Sporobolomyces carnicolor]